MEKARVRKIDGVRGFMPTTYAVYCGELVIKIFLNKKDAEAFANDYNK